MTHWVSRLRAGIALLKPREFALAAAPCPYCGPSLFVRLQREETGVRCTRCAASAVHLALGWALRDQVTHLGECDACELSARGPLVAFLRRSARSLATSEYFADVAPGGLRDGIRCEDVQRLSYADASFDLVTHTEVFEHVPDDARAFAELVRVLRPGGVTIFTVPMHEGELTVERARLRDGALEHVHPPVYHTDPLRDGAGILAFRDYGRDILARLRDAGFAEADLTTPTQRIPWTVPRAVVVARKPA
ncbi:class I SAM-dependent methyltransferase [Dokdonella soli]|uniref:Methyltransferase type 11 domain-containing protein n=1 Tax=Dokdonella soli TaxID=529810 RepID=A0ABN1IQW1_9GAMM